MKQSDDLAVPIVAGGANLGVSDFMPDYKAQRNAIADLLRKADCACSIAERDSGHKMDCWKPFAEDLLSAIDLEK